ncbi:hypothetical protein K439DRAFT_424072 [Ramaria rubella]|nr:hypothetical protein K439DRAFT_424072 [Ramaria rubella]
MSTDTFQQLHKVLWGKNSLESLFYDKTIDRLPSYNPNYLDGAAATYSIVDLSSCHIVDPIFPRHHLKILERSEYRDLLRLFDDLDHNRRGYSGGRCRDRSARNRENLFSLLHPHQEASGGEIHSLARPAWLFFVFR